MGKTAGSRVRARREALGLSQAGLAGQAGLSRQSVSAVEAGRATPSVAVALRLARALQASVEELFGEPVRQPALEAEGLDLRPGERTALARVGERWVSLALGGDGVRLAADGIVARALGGGRALVEPLRPPAELQDNVVLLGCAAGLGLLADRLNARRGPGRFLWFPRSSVAALHALDQGRAHVAGVHLTDARTGEPDLGELRRLAPREPLVLVTLARWEAGLVARARDASPVRSAADLGRRGLRLVGREPGAGAQRLLERTLRAQGIAVERARRPALRAAGHLDVARAVAMGAADTGVATRDAALALGLAFVPLAEERYDLALPRAALADPRLLRLLEVLCSAELRRELDALGYDTRSTGERVAELEAA